MEFKLSENQLTELLVAHFAKYRFSFRKLQISQNTDFSFRKLKIFISQNTDFHFANYSFRKIQIFISFRFTNYSKPYLQYLQAKVSWQSQLETRSSILNVFANRESSLEFRVSRIEFWDTRRIFQDSRIGISRKWFVSRIQNNNNDQ